ncbi:MAG: hypothetical protein CVV21_04485 [Candidatus Goldiibacteriota bacterium HGW-Goldbacteria-1]|nr:MAG: hypothetical protein CVV21_04485 [Candidatus Goldiibacteriota bacterium HGW-Goldbacteria-1]
MQKKVYKFDYSIFLTGVSLLVFVFGADAFLTDSISSGKIKFIAIMVSFFLIWGLIDSYRKVTIDQDIIEFRGVSGRKTLKWEEIKYLYENIPMRRIEMFDGNKKMLMFVDYQMENYDDLINKILSRVNLESGVNRVPRQYSINSKNSMTIDKNGFTYVMLDKDELTLINYWGKHVIKYNEISELKYGCEEFVRYGVKDQSVRIFITTKSGNKVKIYRRRNLPELYFIIKAATSNNICKQCGVINRSDSKFCGECGSSFTG